MIYNKQNLSDFQLKSKLFQRVKGFWLNKSFQNPTKSFNIMLQLLDSQWKVVVCFNSWIKNSFLK